MMTLLGTLMGVMIVVVQGQKAPQMREDRIVIVHLFEWKFEDIAAECERFLGPKGFGAVQVSPVGEYLKIENKNDPVRYRYRPVSYKIAGRSGDEAAFKDMAKKCNDVGVRIYVDVVLNHMAGNADPAVGIAGSTAEPSKLEYPAVPYSPEHFHAPPCDIVKWDDPVQVRNCDLLGLHDLNQTNAHVREKIIGFLNKLVDLGAAGFSIDAAKHMWPCDLDYIYSQVKNLNTEHGFAFGSRPFFYQEVVDLVDSQIKSREYVSFGRVTDFNYGRQLSSCFHGKKSLSYLMDFGPAWGLLSNEDAVVFVDNHNTQRNKDKAVLTYKYPKQYKMAVAFMLAWPLGIPRVMSSYNFTTQNDPPPEDKSPVTGNENQACADGWVCEHRWREISNMVGFTTAATGAPVNTWWTNGRNQISFCRGDRGFIAFNAQEGVDLKRTLPVCVPEGTYCDIISGSKEGDNCTGKTVVVNSDRWAEIEIKSNEEVATIAIHVNSSL